MVEIYCKLLIIQISQSGVDWQIFKLASTHLWTKGGPILIFANTFDTEYNDYNLCRFQYRYRYFCGLLSFAIKTTCT